MNDKLLKIQTELKAPKSKTGTGIKYKYRSCEDILEAVKPLLLATKTTLIITDEVLLIGERYYIKATAILSDGTNKIEAHAIAREAETQAGIGAGQLTGATSSYARKYALNGLFCIDNNDDLDDLSKDKKEQPKTATKDESEKIYDEMAKTGQEENLCSKAQRDELKAKLKQMPFNKLMYHFQQEIPIPVYKAIMSGITIEQVLEDYKHE